MDEKILRRKKDKNSVEELTKNPQKFWHGKTAIGSACFSGNLFLEDIDVVEGIEEIGENAFSNCKNLEKAKLPKSLKKLGSNAFASCSKLKEAHLDRCEINNIPDCTFLDCRNLGLVRLGANVNVIGNSAFSICLGLKNIELGENVKVIGDGAFAFCQKLASINFPSSLIEIKSKAFNGCSSLKEVNLQHGIEKIGDVAFKGCKSIEFALIPSSVTEIGGGTFKDCSSLKKVQLESPIKRLSSNMFAGCISLKDVSISNAITQIGKYGFYGCVNLEKFEMGQNVENIEAFAFGNCSSLKHVKLSNSLLQISNSSFSNCVALEKIELPESLFEIGKGAFENCKNLKYVVIPNGIYVLEEDTFAHCCSLKEVVFPSDLKTIKLNAFKNCLSLEHVLIPDSVLSIGGFSGCTNLKSVIMSKNAKEFTSNAFSETGLKSVVFPEGIENVGQSAFANCLSLENVIFSNNLKRISNCSFEGCTALKEITIPNSVNIIGNRAFANCYNLEKVSIPSNVELFSKDCFAGCKFKYFYIDKITGNYVLSKFLPADIEKCDDITDISRLEKYIPNISYVDLLKFPYRNDILKLTSKLESAKLTFDSCFVNHFFELYNHSNLLVNDFNFKFLSKELLAGDKNALYNLQYKDLIFAKLLGCFSNTKIVDGKGMPTSTSLAQKASSFFSYIYKNKSKTNYNELLSALSYNHFLTEPNQKLLNFLSSDDGEKNFTNLKTLLYCVGDNTALLSKILLDFDLLFKCRFVVVNKKMKKLSWENAIKRFDAIKKYPDVKEEDYDIAELLAPYFNQEAIKHLSKLRKDAIINNISKQILSVPLKEETIVESIEKIKNDTSKILTDTKTLIDQLYEKKFTYEFLDKHDIKNAILGIEPYCDACSFLLSGCYGADIAELTFKYNNTQNIVIRDVKGDIIAKGTLVVFKDKGEAIINSFEINYKYKRHMQKIQGFYDVKPSHPDEIEREYIFKAFKRAVNAFAKQYDLENPTRPLKEVIVGDGYNKLKRQTHALKQRREHFVVPPKYYFNDAGDAQFILYEREEIKKQVGND